MASSRNKKVRNITQPVKGVSNTNAPLTENNLRFDFTYKDWLKSISVKKFTNRLTDEKQFAEYIFEVFSKIIPTVQQNWDNIKLNTKTQFPHCHTLPNEKISLIREVFVNIHGRPLIEDDSSLKFWQLGISQGIRVIAIYNDSNSTMYPIFIDYHHLIYSSVKHNQKDYDHYPFCPFCMFSKSKIKVQSS